MPDSKQLDHSFVASLPRWYGPVLLAGVGAVLIGMIFLYSGIISGSPMFAVIVFVLIGALAYIALVRTAVALSLDSGQLHWKAPLAKGSVPVEAVRRMRPVLGTAAMKIDVADRRPIFVTTCRGLDELGNVLEKTIPGFTYEISGAARFARFAARSRR